MRCRGLRGGLSYATIRLHLLNAPGANALKGLANVNINLHTFSGTLNTTTTSHLICHLFAYNVIVLS